MSEGKRVIGAHLDASMRRRLERFRRERGLRSTSEAMRRLIAAGLKAEQVR